MIYIFLFCILLVHWIADFVLQTDCDAKGKSTSLKHLLSHTVDYSLVWFTITVILCSIGILPLFFMWFPLITFICHTITDYFTSKWTARLLREGKTHDFFVVIGFDQLLHYVQLFGTFFFLLYLI